MLQLGDVAPNFRLENDLGDWVTLSGLIVNGPVVLAFYPGDFSLICTKQLCAYQTYYPKFRNFGLDIVGVSHNPPAEHRQFRERYGFGFPLLSDMDRSVTRRYGVTSILMLGGQSRAVFIIGKTGRILFRYVEPTTLTHRKPDELLKIVMGLRSQGSL